MERTRLLCGLIATVALTGCAAPVDPVAKAEMDARIAGLRTASTIVPAPAAFESMPLAVGQWAEYELTTRSDQPQFLTQKVVAQEEDGVFWFEIVHDSYDGRTVEQLLVAVGDRRDPAKVELRAVRMRDGNGPVTTLSRGDLWVAKNQLSLTGRYWDDAVDAALIINWRGQPQEATIVPAGRFDGCYCKHSESLLSRWVHGRRAQDSWSHPAVPLSGLVRLQAYFVVDGRAKAPHVVSELVAYGTTGARSEL
ncbi:MAG TPA: hypothetical protein VIF57_16790 [Polyangia bacterium]|jgi:hypothetical protein